MKYIKDFNLYNYRRVNDERTLYFGMFKGRQIFTYIEKLLKYSLKHKSLDDETKLIINHLINDCSYSTNIQHFSEFSNYFFMMMSFAKNYNDNSEIDKYLIENSHQDRIIEEFAFSLFKDTKILSIEKYSKTWDRFDKIKDKSLLSDTTYDNLKGEIQLTDTEYDNFLNFIEKLKIKNK